jgi:peroxidase
MMFSAERAAVAAVVVVALGVASVAVLAGGVVPSWTDGELRSPVHRGKRPAEIDRRREAQPPPPPGPAVFPDEFRTIDGHGNNPHPDRLGWGAAGVAMLRVTPIGYGDGVGSPAGAGRPSARAVSNAVCAQAADLPNPRSASSYLWQWGQFLDHDFDETPVADPGDPFDIPVPAGDLWFDPQNTGTE